MARILFIDDDAGGRQMATFNLRQAGHTIHEAEDGQSGLSQFASHKYDLVITDLRMPDLSGIEVTRQLHERAPEVPVLIITAFGTIQTAVEAIKAGAYDFVLKPFSRDQLMMAVDKALEHERLLRENRELKRKVLGVERPIVYESATMKKTLELVDRVARSEACTLVTGESGTGKELVGRRIHARSQRGEQPFVALNCAAIPGELIEAELFGHEKGAFTGANQARIGRFRQADGGTLFLDEIAELPLVAQGKLLRVLQESVVDVIGSDQPVAVNTRVIAATNKDLQKEVAAGRFREDLYFRLNVVELEVPALRTRVQDIPILAQHFVREFAQGQEFVIPKEVLRALSARRWVGNVRELKNACERMAILCPGNILDVNLLPAERTATFTQASEQQDQELKLNEWLSLPGEGFSLLDLEKTVIERVLALKNNNISEAARYLRVPRHILVYRVEKYGIARPPRN